MSGFVYNFMGTLILIQLGAIAAVIGMQIYRALTHTFWAVPITHYEAERSVRFVDESSDSQGEVRNIA